MVGPLRLFNTSATPSDASLDMSISSSGQAFLQSVREPFQKRFPLQFPRPARSALDPSGCGWLMMGGARRGHQPMSGLYLRWPLF